MHAPHLPAICPACMSAASNVFSLFQTAFLKIPAVKHAVGLPDLSQLRGGKQAAAAGVDLAGKPVQTFMHKPQRARKAAEDAAPPQQ